MNIRAPGNFPEICRIERQLRPAEIVGGDVHERFAGKDGLELELEIRRRSRRGAADIEIMNIIAGFEGVNKRPAAQQPAGLIRGASAWGNPAGGVAGDEDDGGLLDAFV
jgi:hypothetical protein